MTDWTRRLSPEVLAACFEFLWLEDLLSASHVSCSWRSAALAFPALWSYIDIRHSSAENPALLLHLAVSRAGKLPLDFEYIEYSHAADQRLLDAISQYFGRFRSFHWSSDPDDIDISSPAPILREFCFEGSTCIVSQDFLGGCVGALRTLHLDDAIFPETCPALMTVTDLRATYPVLIYPGTDENRRFHRIFDLCPRLEVLHLRDLPMDSGGELPAGLAPRTLRKVTLESWMCNLVRLYTMWGLESVADVDLTVVMDMSLKLASVIDGAVDLAVVYAGYQQAYIVARLSGTRKRKVLTNGTYDTEKNIAVLEEMLRNGTALSHMESLRVPLSVLRPALEGAFHWPQLASLSVHVYTNDLTGRQTECPWFRWSVLNCLRTAPALESLALHVEADRMSLDDARDLRGYLSTLAGCIPREVHVYGFPGNIGHQLPAHACDEPRVIFSERDLSIGCFLDGVEDPLI
ncbi:hypothetical protein AURDEDRAFT_116055 [Auricularia subglabra TFB-10046 SS5]|uniref:F-box domain-containing protein n=1 Tax=Auricularia subglabra (strain TFB-10046 / SS5) TaxID=717982 RepID=J0DCA6_AURST|nr:hypothetical protein AURDEDRAFT_116055 [Auricularia subglabra TFB-10046 SS5]